MDTARLQQIQGLFLEAADLPDSERGGFLDTACGDDHALRAEVLAMLQEDADDGSLLDGALPQLARHILSESPASHFPEQLGPYRLLRMLGEGGMGVVFLAERADLGSLVAIKILRNAWMSPARRERFASEQRTLAQLKHPSIARLYDADTLPDGTPWFVMEYVEGVPITDYCSVHNSSIEERLRLFRSVLEAVQYAHGHAIIHRDLKPSNILVRADGTIGLLDFGISKQLDDLGQPVDQTRTELRLMTPAYAAPEQLRGERVGIFTDVYALGVILYQLLAGSAPFDLSSRTPGEAERIIVDQEPVKPSAAASARGSFWADLDVLCLTAMHRDAERRYRSTEALMRDVDHYLAGEPLEARPDTWHYRIGKFVRRNRRAVIATALTVAAATALIVFFTVRLATARNTAVAAVARMQRVQQFMLNLFSGGDKSAGPAEGLKAVTLVDRGIQEAQTLKEEPELQAELYLTLGSIEQKLGDLPKADMLFNAALRPRNPENLVALGLLRVDQARLDDAERLIREGLSKAGAERPRDDRAIAKATAALGKVLEAKGSYEKAIPVLEEAVRLDSASGAAPLDSASDLKELADTQFYAGRYDLCESLTKRTLLIHRQVLGDRHPLVADDLINLGAVQFERGRYEEAERWYRQALEINERWYGHDHPETASTLSMLGRTLVFQKRYDEAVNLVEQALAIQERVYGATHPKVANVLNELGTVALQRGRFEDAAARFSRMVAIYKISYGERHYLYGLALSNLASVYLAQKDYSRAEQMFRQAIQCYAVTLSPTHQFRAIAEIKLGRALTGEKRYAEAESETLAGYNMLLKQTSPTVSWLQSARKDLVTIYDALKQPGKAAQFRTELADTVAKK
ncbi:MAG TPA: serine/threonine-protein kinase [Bryobacteraceae bacterium]|nr:serine/threonine-protein kinase [Bryobacteraceae bacterium]